ncbi:Hypothetical predicted protein, partial [Scomber scombrus]
SASSAGSDPAGITPPARSGDEGVEGSDQQKGEQDRQGESNSEELLENSPETPADINVTSESDESSGSDDYFDDEEMSDDDLLKVSQKRKHQEPVQSKAKSLKVQQGLKAGRPSVESESDFSLTQEDQQSHYSPAEITKFLRATKGHRLETVC